MSLRKGLRVSYFFSWPHFCDARATLGLDALASASMPIAKGIISSMHQAVMKKPDVGCADHTQYYSLTIPATKDNTAGEPINTQNRSDAVDDLSVAQTSSDQSNNIVFHGRTMKALKASANGPHRYDEIYQIVMPRQRVVTRVDGTVRALEQFC
jgi:hypothetical protein